MKKEKISKKVPYIDYECKLNERVQWDTITGKHYEGIILEWKENYIAIVKLDDNSTIEVQC